MKCVLANSDELFFILKHNLEKTKQLLYDAYVQYSMNKINLLYPKYPLVCASFLKTIAFVGIFATFLCMNSFPVNAALPWLLLSSVSLKIKASDWQEMHVKG